MGYRGVHLMHDPAKRSADKVPFVELFGDRLQGVVSSGSDLERVYVSLVHAKALTYACSTNNNRPCGGLRGAPCKHIDALVAQAVAPYGPQRVARHLALPGDPAGYADARAIVAALPPGQAVKASASEVFSRFLHDLRYVQLPASYEPAPDMVWFTEG